MDARLIWKIESARLSHVDPMALLEVMAATSRGAT
jgi:hypothetical protein